MQPLYAFSRFIVRCFKPRYNHQPTSETIEPAVYIVQHQNLRGPFTVMAWFPRHLRLWALSVFFTQRDCYRQFIDYTFTKRYGLPKILAAIIVWPISFYISRLMRSMEAIPVYRSRKAVLTFKQSITALTNSQSILICPNIEYTDTSDNIGEIYSGFLNLEKYYYKQTGQHLAFVPLYLNHGKRMIIQGNAVFFPGEEAFEKEKAQMAEHLRQEINSLAEL